MLRSQVLGDVRLHGVHTLCDRLLTKSALTPEIGPQSLFLAETSSCAHGLIKG